MSQPQRLLSLYTRTPLHVGCGTSVDVVDLPLMRERITNFPVIPSTSLKGVLRQAGRDLARAAGGEGNGGYDLAANDALFGNKDATVKDAEGKEQFHAGCVQIMEAKLLAFPVRSLAGCFAWLTCPAILRRFQRDSASVLDLAGLAEVAKDEALVGPGSEVAEQGQVVLEEYALKAREHAEHRAIAASLRSLVDDPLWQDKLAKRLVVLHDEDFQHFVSTCTEVVARIVIDAGSRTVGNLFNQENVPCEALFYSVLTVFNVRRSGFSGQPDALLDQLLAGHPLVQIGGDETTGHGLCEMKPHPLPFANAQA